MKELTKTGKIVIPVVLIILLVLVIFGGCKATQYFDEERRINGLEVPNNDY